MARIYGDDLAVLDESGKQYWHVTMRCDTDDRSYPFPTGKAAWKFAEHTRSSHPTFRVAIYHKDGSLYASWKPKSSI